ncbi:hypothetical protein K7B10_34000 [Streptomyces flavotricini]|uniref:Uncharacterized protein n=1 Tax=Streptomyces flavotricini TaxID=66888 RepID=A0ABS8EFD4_9ACTN|nr:hypothetical protein [Streptomyces flavotricini]MCC0099707.1 hypothetical protein [Streptomyces flavotricini]
MPRRRPGALRAERGTYEDRRPPVWARELPPVDRLSPAASAGVQWVQHEQSTSGTDLADLLRRYRAFLNRPGGRLRLVASRVPACPCCALDDVAEVRDRLAEVYRRLPPQARTALGRVLCALDAEFRRRTLPDPDPPPGHWADWIEYVDDWAQWRGIPYAWWHRRIYEHT